MPARLERTVYRAVLKVLRPAESAARRLIVIVARGLVATIRASRPMPERLSRSAAGRALMPFQLFDARKRFGARAIRRGAEPRLTILGARGPSCRCFRRARRRAPYASLMTEW